MKKGFASITIVYSFLIVFILSLLVLLAFYTQKARLVDSIVIDAKEEILNYKNVANEENISLFKVVTAGSSNMMVIDSVGDLWGWGANNSHLAGASNNNPQLTPIKIPHPEGKKWIDVSIGGGHILALDVEKNLWAWGGNAYGQLAVEVVWPWSISTPAKIINPDGKKLKSISAGGDHSMAIDEANNLWTWGWNYWYQLGNPENTSEYTVALNKITNSDGTLWKSISAGSSHSMAIDEANNLWTWGNNSSGQLGIDNTNIEKSNIPSKVVNDNNTLWKKIFDSEGASIALDINDTLWVWGYNIYQQLGLNSYGNKYKPYILSNPEGKTWAHLSGGTQHTVGLDNEGNLWTWGDGAKGQLGTGDTTDKSTPYKIIIENNEEVVSLLSIASGPSSNIAMDSLGNLWTWGYNYAGQLGNGDSTNANVLIPTMLVPFN